jgi:hypothetical protein
MVAPKVPGGPDRLRDLIHISLSQPAGVEAFRSDIRRAPHVPDAAAQQAAAALRLIDARRGESDEQYMAAARAALARIKEQLVARLSCRQADWHPPIR